MKPTVRWRRSRDEKGWRLVCPACHYYGALFLCQQNNGLATDWIRPPLRELLEPFILSYFGYKVAI